MAFEAPDDPYFEEDMRELKYSLSANTDELDEVIIGKRMIDNAPDPIYMLLHFQPSSITFKLEHVVPASAFVTQKITERILREARYNGTDMLCKILNVAGRLLLLQVLHTDLFQEICHQLLSAGTTAPIRLLRAAQDAELEEVDELGGPEGYSLRRDRSEEGLWWLTLQPAGMRRLKDPTSGGTGSGGGLGKKEARGADSTSSAASASTSGSAVGSGERRGEARDKAAQSVAEAMRGLKEGDQSQAHYLVMPPTGCHWGARTPGDSLQAVDSARLPCMLFQTRVSPEQAQALTPQELEAVASLLEVLPDQPQYYLIHCTPNTHRPGEQRFFDSWDELPSAPQGPVLGQTDWEALSATSERMRRLHVFHLDLHAAVTRRPSSAPGAPPTPSAANPERRRRKQRTQVRSTEAAAAATRMPLVLGPADRARRRLTLRRHTSLALSVRHQSLTVPGTDVAMRSRRGMFKLL